MPSKNRLTIMSPSEGLDPVSRFGKAPRRFVRVKNGSLHDGEILLKLSLRELGMIRRISREMRGPRPELFHDAKTQYDDLKEEFERLATDLQSTSWFNFAKRLELRRATHAFVEAGYELYITTQSTSERMQRGQLSCNSLVEDVEEGDIAPDERVRGVALDDVEGPLSDEEASILTSDPFADPVGANDADNRMAFQNIYNVFIGCVNADNSDAREITMKNA